MRVRRAATTDADAVMTSLDVAARRHQRMPWVRAQVQQGIVEEETLLGYVQSAPVATATLSRAMPAAGVQATQTAST